MTGCISTVNAEEQEVLNTTEKPSTEVPAWVKNIKFSGYGIVQYQGNDKEGAHENTFNLRLLRMILDGKISDVAWRVQVQGTGSSLFLCDLYAEWVKHEAFRVRAGQFKRPFTFENPTHPITQGWYSYAQVINQLSAFGDRSGEKSAGGRDIGVQLQGDLLKNANGRNLIHYQVGVFNGEGINTKDKDNRKDIIGGFWVMPVQGFRLGAFGWTGSRGGIGAKNRYALSAEYDKDEWTFRTEYVHSQGWGAAKAGSGETTIDYSKGDKADGWYIFGIAPVVKSKLHLKARYQFYRESKEWSTAAHYYEFGANYMFNKNLELHLDYARVNQRGTNQKYNFIDAQLGFRF